MQAQASRLTPGDGVDRPANCPAVPATRRASSTDRPEIVAETLYVVGGLYGNVEALDARAATGGARARAVVTIVFNGDFHWFDVDAGEFRRIEREVPRAPALRGNVETEIAGEDVGARAAAARIPST